MPPPANALKFKLMRLGRRLIWPSPLVYAPYGICRHQFNVLATSHDIYIDGYPRSGNTFALKAFSLANPGVRVRSHQHVPTFVVQSVKRREPGMVLIRKPIDAAISWSIYEGEPLRNSLAYYTDFYSVLLKHREDLFFVSFESVVADFGLVLRDFNERWGTRYTLFDHTPQNAATCFAQIDEDYVDPSGKIYELRVARPSRHRRPLKLKLMRQIGESPALEKELRRAIRVYQELVPRKFMSRRRPELSKTTQSIRLRPAG
jgi:hypothetical protein